MECKCIPNTIFCKKFVDNHRWLKFKGQSVAHAIACNPNDVYLLKIYDLLSKVVSSKLKSAFAFSDRVKNYT